MISCQPEEHLKSVFRRASLDISCLPGRLTLQGRMSARGALWGAYSGSHPAAAQAGLSRRHQPEVLPGQGLSVRQPRRERPRLRSDHANTLENLNRPREPDEEFG